MSAGDKTDDLKLPTAVIQRLVKSAVSDKTIVSRETKTAIARAASVFILHTSNFANEAAVSNNRKTINAQDVLQGLSDLDCDELIEPVREALHAWREEQKAKKAAKKPRLSDTTAAVDDGEPQTNGEDRQEATENDVTTGQSDSAVVTDESPAENGAETGTADDGADDTSDSAQ